MKPDAIHVQVSLLGEKKPANLRISPDATIAELLVEAAKGLGASLLPNADRPLDRLHNVGKHDVVGPPLADLEETVGQVLDGEGATHDFALELVRAIRVNTRWAVASAAEMSPRNILGLPGIDLKPEEYTLYRPNSSEPLPLDAEVAVARGDVFEAQRDGRYGGSSRGA
jgi:hypothetical protein